MRWVKVCLIGFAAIIQAGCQTTDPAEYRTAADLLLDLSHRSPDSLSSMPPIGPVEKPFTAALNAVLDGDRAAADEHAAAAGYRIVDKQYNGKGYAILLESDGAGIGPVVAIAKTPARDAIIEAPHPVKDSHTNKQAAVLFLKLGARALIVAGANRCAARDESPCSGMTGICGGGRAPYRTSDPAHNPATLFHVAHRTLTRRWEKSIAIQMHGFNNSGSSVWFVMSDGTNERRPGDASLVGKVRDRIHTVLGRKERAVSCQDPNDRSIRTRWLCATTTVQGRDLNGSPDICRVAAKKSSGRFLHIEQALREVRRPYDRDWKNISQYPGSNAILEALAQELPCLQPGCAPVRR
jgi:hypothetical protein